MSLSNPRQAGIDKKNFSLRLSTGHVTWYDKSVSKEVEVDTPFKFLVLDSLNFIGGFNESINSGLWSNEVRSTRDSVLTVRSKKGVVATGLYDAIKDEVRKAGGKFGNSLYIAYLEGGEWALGNLKLLGAGLSEWFDFRQGRNLDRDPGVAITGWEARKKGRNDYFVPVFQGLSVTDEQLAAARVLDEGLQAYLNSSLNRTEAPQETPQPAYAGSSFGAQGDFDESPPF